MAYLWVSCNFFLTCAFKGFEFFIAFAWNVAMQSHITNEISNIFHYQRHIAIKRDKVVITIKWLSRAMSHNTLNMWSREVTWQIEYVIFLLPQGPWLLNVARWCLAMSSFHPVIQPTKYVIFGDHLTNQKRFITNTTVLEATKGNSLWGAPNDKVTWPFKQVIIWGDVTN